MPFGKEKKYREWKRKSMQKNRKRIDRFKNLAKQCKKWSFLSENGY